MIKVFISSTGVDLKVYRKAAIEICNELGIIPIAMEFFEAMEPGATKGSIEKIKSCDLLICIIGNRYGYIEDGYLKSVTEIEYETAGKEGIDRLCFLLSEDYPWPQKYYDHENYQFLNNFRNRIDKEHIRKNFTTVDDFRTKLTTSLYKWMFKETKIINTNQFNISTKKRKDYFIPGKSYDILIGRDSFINEIVQALHEESVKVICIDGIGGLGKTALVRATLDKIIRDQAFDFYLWDEVNKDDYSDLDLVSNLSKQLGLSQLQNKSHEEKSMELRQIMRTNKVVAIIDGLEISGSNFTAIVNQLLNICNGSKVLITSRKRIESSDVYHIHLPELSEADSAQLLKHIGETKNIRSISKFRKSNFDEINQTIGGLPLAIKLTAGLLDNLPIESILRDFTNLSKLDLMEEDSEYSRIYKHIFFPLFESLTFESKHLLSFLAWYPPLVGGDYQALKTVTEWEDGKLDNSLNELWRYSFVEVTEPNKENIKRYYLHNLTYHFMRSDILGEDE